MTRILAGERRELGRLAERMRCIVRILRVLNLKHGCTLGEDELADLSQDVLVIVWRKLPEYQGLVALEGWVYGFCALELKNALRKKRRRAPEADVSGAEAVSALASPPEPSRWDFDHVHACLGRIAPEEARVIRLKHFEERTFEEIGRLLEVSPNTIKARYYRGLMELRALMRKETDQP